MDVNVSTTRRLTSVVLLAALAGCSGADAPPSAAAGAGAAHAPPAAAAEARTGNTCLDKKDLDAKGENGYHCIDTSMMSEESLCLRQSGQAPKHVRGLTFAPGTLPQALITRAKNAQGVVIDGSAIVDKGQEPTDPQATCGSRPILFLQKTDSFSILPDDTGTKLLLRVMDAQGNAKDHFPKDGLELTPDPGGGHLFWTAKSDGIDFYVMLADDRAGSPADAHVPWIERYIWIEAYWHDDDKQDPDCAARRPNNDATKGNFHRWNGSADRNCIAEGAKSQNGSGGGGHNYP